MTNYLLFSFTPKLHLIPFTRIYLETWFWSPPFLKHKVKYEKLEIQGFLLQMTRVNHFASQNGNLKISSVTSVCPFRSLYGIGPWGQMPHPPSETLFIWSIRVPMTLMHSIFAFKFKTLVQTALTRCIKVCEIMNSFLNIPNLLNRIVFEP